MSAVSTDGLNGSAETSRDSYLQGTLKLMQMAKGNIDCLEKRQKKKIFNGKKQNLDNEMAVS